MLATDDTTEDYRRLPGLYRLWDLPFVLNRSEDWRIHYADLTDDGTPLFAVYRRARDTGRVTP